MISSVIFVHGLRGHPQGTWQAASVNSGSDSGIGSSTTKKPGGFKSLFKRRTARSLSEDSTQAHSLSSPASSPPPPSQIFWPEEYLAQDIPEARVWTYGYNADVIGILFEAKNKNSISQHGQDLSSRLEREIQNEVG